MTKTEILARLDDKIRPLMMDISPFLSSLIYSHSREIFLNMMKKEKATPIKFYNPIIELWGLNFQSSIFNAAGMFKDGRGYDFCEAIGAGAFLAGTATREPRIGNKKKGISKPFLSYQRSGAASNWMGLPNEGIEVIAERLSKIDKKKNCPIGVSLASNPEYSGEKALSGLIECLEFSSKANVDFIELNESCPNVPHECQISESGLDVALINRLERISELFIKKQIHKRPIIVKFSNDTEKSLVPKLINTLVELGFDGANFGNTSTDYGYCRNLIDSNDLAGFDFFIDTFGGGISGAPLKDKSLSLCQSAVECLKSLRLEKEFHIIRTGGVNSSEDLEASKESGIALNQWFTGFFDNYAKIGKNLYKNICEKS